MKTLLIDLYEEHDLEKNVYQCLMTDTSHVLFLSLDRPPRFATLQVEEFIERHIPSIESVFFETIDFQVVDDLVGRQVAQFDQVLVDTHGGDALLAVALYRAAMKHGCQVVSLDVNKGQVHHWLPDRVEVQSRIIPTLTTEQVITLRGGEIIRSKQPHYSPHQQVALVKIARFALKSPQKWYQSTQYFSALKVSESFRVLAPKTVRHANGRSYVYPTQLIQLFKDSGALKVYQELNHSVDLGFGTSENRQLLSSKGAILELYLYLLAQGSGQFDQVYMSVEIDWNGIIYELNNVQNEIDLVLQKGRKHAFVSCKMTEATPAAINELELYAEHFLGDDCIKVFVCTGEVSPAYANRCREYGIILIGRDDVANFVTIVSGAMG